MLKKKQRLGRRDLALFFKSRPKRFFGEQISISCLKNKLGVSRFAFVALRAPSANLRNLARRRMAEAVAKEMKNIPAGYDIAIFMNIGKTVPKFDIILKNIKDVLDSAHL